MVAMSGRETFISERKARIVSGREGFDGEGVGGVWLRRVERRVVEVAGGGGGAGAGVEEEREEEADRWGVISSLDGGWKTTVRYIAAMAMRWGGYKRQRLDRYVSLMMNLGAECG